MQEKGAVRIGVDIGGTFTDVVLAADGEVKTLKLLTTHDAPERAVIDGLDQLVKETGVAPCKVTSLIHGTTLATNAIIERKGARTAFITTMGHRDTLEIRDEHRFDLYDLKISLPAPLVPRNLRFTVEERMDARGKPIVPLCEEEVARIAELMRIERIESVAIGFLHSYANPKHEERAAEIISDFLPDVSVCYSSNICPEMREYERFSTTVANAYVQPKISEYLDRLELALSDRGYKSPLLMMLSGGGLSTLETCRKFPVRLVESGPAGGAIFAANIAAMYGLRSAVSFDMGGTTAKICLIEGGKPEKARVFEAARSYSFKKGSGLPLRIPVVEMIEIGAGGGSVAKVDILGRLKVGPESAGSEPGPACYGRDGVAPTVTDADLCLGRIDASRFAGGLMKLDSDRASRALKNQVAGPLGIKLEAAAALTSEMVEENMANAARVYCTERGKSLSDSVIIAFGGAAGLHVARLADKLEVDRIIIPRHAGVGSAMGFLEAPISFDFVVSLRMPMSEFRGSKIIERYNQIEIEARDKIFQQLADTEFHFGRSVFMRYVGQGHELELSLQDLAETHFSADNLASRFEEAYRTKFSRLVPNTPIEITAICLNISTLKPSTEMFVTSEAATIPSSIGTTRVFERGSWSDVPVFLRSLLGNGDHIRGPALLVEDETSILLSSEFGAVIDQIGSVDCKRLAGAEQ